MHEVMQVNKRLEAIMSTVDRVLVGEALVVEDRPNVENCPDLRNVAHIDLVMGPRGSIAEETFCRALTDQKDGANGLLAILAPNLMVKPATVMFNKVTIRNEKQAVQMFGPAQRGVAMAVMDCVAEGLIPKEEVDDIFISVGVYISTRADMDERVEEWNYQATRQAIKNAINREPNIDKLLTEYKNSVHPFAAKH
jgi:5,6,7,8-tetrahydromethanopterin hydro-lyase